MWTKEDGIVFHRCEDCRPSAVNHLGRIRVVRNIEIYCGIR